MKNMKFWRTALVATLVLTVMLSVTGGTIAWFTDSVTSESNIIKSGTLNVDMHWADGTKAVPAPDSTDWQDAAEGAIFDYKLWEPGYVQVRHVKIANTGTLALKYKVEIEPTGEVTDLTDVIDVYYTDPAVQVANRTDLSASNKLGTLTEVLAGMATTAAGELEAGESDTITIALKMQESAGNEYQGKSIGDSFKLVLVATQLMSEEDSFGDDYDEDARYPGEVTTADELTAAIAEGKSVKLAADVAVDSYLSVAEGAEAVIDLNGHDLEVGGNAPVINNNGHLTIKGNGNIAVKQMNNGEGSTLIIDGATIQANGDYAINNEGTLIIDDATITGGRDVIKNTMGTITINGGTFTCSASMGAVIHQMGDGETIINGGTFTQNGSDPLVNVEYGGKLTVNGGTFDATSMFCGWADVTVNAGVFMNNAKVVDYIGDITSKVPSTSTATTNADGSITVTVNGN